MDAQKQPLPLASDPPHHSSVTQPPWWTIHHDASWERVRDAFRRDWQQTKADLFPGGAGQLNQGVVDTVKQALGAVPVPPDTQKSHPDTTQQAARAHLRLVRDQRRSKARMERLADRIARERALLTNESAAETAEQKATAVVERQPTPSPTGADAVERDVAMAVWVSVEPAARYGYVVRTRALAAPVWDAQLEETLRAEWNTLHTGMTWEDAAEDVRCGWEFGARELLAAPVQPQRRDHNF